MTSFKPSRSDVEEAEAAAEPMAAQLRGPRNVVDETDQGAARRRWSETRLDCARRLMEQYELREKVFGELASLFGDPGHDILLLIYTRALEARQISVSAVCTAGDTKSTTGLRWLGALAAKGLVHRTPDGGDRRRAFVELTAAGKAYMDGYIDMVRL